MNVYLLSGLITVADFTYMYATGIVGQGYVFLGMYAICSNLSCRIKPAVGFTQGEQLLYPDRQID